jgi:hypothetical protein
MKLQSNGEKKTSVGWARGVSHVGVELKHKIKRVYSHLVGVKIFTMGCACGEDIT